jgi:hypothetical protein
VLGSVTTSGSTLRRCVPQEKRSADASEPNIGARTTIAGERLMCSLRDNDLTSVSDAPAMHVLHPAVNRNQLLLAGSKSAAPANTNSR